MYTVNVKNCWLMSDDKGNSSLVMPLERDGIGAAQQFIKNQGENLFTAILKLFRKRRSLDANGFLWVLCDKIAKVVGNTKEFVYQSAVRDVGVFTVVPIADVAADEYIRKWCFMGIGNFAEVLHDSKLPGYKNIITYFGSSTYDTAEMSRLIDHVVFEAKALGIETMTPDEIARMKALWTTIEPVSCAAETA